MVARRSETDEGALPAFVPPFSSPNGMHKQGNHGEAHRQKQQTKSLLQSPGVPKIGAGLTNLGNTCFLNSVLQCLTYTAPLAAYLQSGLHKSTCRAAGFCAMCALEIHVKKALTASGSSFSPTYLVKNLRCISQSFRMWRQEDAHEYMRYLIEALHKCCPIKNLGGGTKTFQESLIQQMFGGRLRSQVKCTKCSHCSNTYDPFLDLSLEVARADSLQKALAHFTAVEILEGDNKYQCGKCNTKVRALKRFTIDKAPHVLTIQLKRFGSLGGHGAKIDKKIHFGTTLDIKPFANGGEEEELKYSLYAILVHAGWSTHSGHYYCFVRTARGLWHVLDDSRVCQVSEKTVLEQKAYILFYIRGTVKPHGNIAKDISCNGALKVDGTKVDGVSRFAAKESSVRDTNSAKDIGGSSCASDPTIKKQVDPHLDSTFFEGNKPDGLAGLHHGQNNSRTPLNGDVKGSMLDSDEILVLKTRLKEAATVSSDGAASAVRSVFAEAADIAVPTSNGSQGLGAQNVPDETRSHSGNLLGDRNEKSGSGKRKKALSENEQNLILGGTGNSQCKKRKKIRHKLCEKCAPQASDVPAQSNSIEAVAVKTSSQKLNCRLKRLKRRKVAMIHKMFIRRNRFKFL